MGLSHSDMRRWHEIGNIGRKLWLTNLGTWKYIMESPLVYWQSHYQQKCPIYQNSKAVRDMVLLLMLLFLHSCNLLVTRVLLHLLSFLHHSSLLVTHSLLRYHTFLLLSFLHLSSTPLSRVHENGDAPDPLVGLSTSRQGRRQLSLHHLSPPPVVPSS